MGEEKILHIIKNSMLHKITGISVLSYRYRSFSFTSACEN